MMKRTILMIAIVAGSNADAVRRQETVSAGAELAARNEAEAKIKAIEAIQKRTPAGTIRELEAAVDNAQAAINKLPGLVTGLQDRLNQTTLKTLGPILRAHAAGNAALMDEINDNMNPAIGLLVESVNKRTAQLAYVDASGNRIDLSYRDVANQANARNSNEWQDLMNDMNRYAERRARLMDAIIENWVSQISKEETAKLKTADPVKFNAVQAKLKLFYDKAIQFYITTLNNMTNATKQAEFRKAIQPIQNKIEEFKKEVMKKGFII